MSAEVSTDTIRAEAYLVDDYDLTKQSEVMDEGDVNADNSINSSILSSENEIHYFPSCKKLNKILIDSGYAPLEMSSSDIDFQNKSISIFIVDAWAESMLTSISEMFEREMSQRSFTSNASIYACRRDTGQETLVMELNDAKLKLKSALKLNKDLERRISSAGTIIYPLFLCNSYNYYITEELLDSKTKFYKNFEFEMKKKLKVLETQLQVFFFIFNNIMSRNPYLSFYEFHLKNHSL